MKIRSKFASTFILFALCLTIIGLVEHQYINKVADNFRSFESQTGPSLTALLETITATRRASIKAMEFSIHGKPIDRDKSHEALQQLTQQFNQYLQLNNEIVGSEYINKITILKNDFDNVIYDYLSFSDGPAVKLVFEEEKKLQTDRRNLIHAANRAIQQFPRSLRYELLEIKGEARKVSIKLIEFSFRGIPSDKVKALESIKALQKINSKFIQSGSEYPQIINNLSGKVDLYIDTASYFLQLLSTKQNSVDSIYSKEEEVHKARKALIQTLYPLINELYIQQKKITDSTATQLTLSSQFQLYSTLFITLLAMIGAFVLARVITSPLNKLNEAANLIGQGNLDIKIDIQSQDEIGQLAKSFQRMLKNLKKQNEQIKDSEEKFSKAFYHQPVAMQIVDLEKGMRVEINQKFCELMGYSRDELLNSSITEKNLWINPDQQKPQIEAVKQKGHIENWPMDIRQKTGEERYTMVSAATLKLAKQDLIIATHVDITDSIKLEQQLRSNQQHLEKNIKQRNEELEKLRQTEERLENAQHIARIGNWELELATSKLHWSDEIFRIFDIDHQKFEASYDAFLNAIHPDDREKVSTAYENSLKDKTPYTIEHRLLMPDGSVKYVIEKCKTTFTEDGTPIQSVGTVQDITERKLNESLSLRMNRMFEHSIEEIYIFDGEKLNFLKISRGALENLGYSMQEISELTPIDIKPDFSEKQFKLYIEPLISGKQQQLKFETRHQRKDGSTYPVEVSLQYASEDVSPVFLAIIEDVTERKRIEAELESHRSHLEKLVEERTSTIKMQAKIIDQTNDSVITVNLDGNITSWNGGAERLFKIPAETAIGQPITLVYPKNSAEFLQKEIVDPVKTKGSHEVEVRLKRGDNTEFPAHLSLTMLYDKKGTPTGTVGYTIDLTEQKKREQELLLLTRQLQDSNKELEAFSYSVSHDLRSPLRSIDGFSLAIVEDYGDQLGATGKDYLDRVRKAAQRMGLLIDELLDLSRVNRAEMKQQKLNLNEIAQRSFDELKTNDPKRQIKLIMDDSMQLQADERLFGIIMDNLVGNAWKFTAGQEKALITIKSLPDKPEVFYIKDNGVGFDMRHADKLFGVFQRLHQVKEFPGTGVGLATVQRIIHRHGGQIWAEAEQGKGATFFFTLNSNVL